MTLRSGDLIGGRYLLTRPIAMGGMGAVWSATDQVLGRTVAVKLLKPEYSSDKGFLDRFRAEARHSAGLSHPNIAAVYDYGEANDPSTHSGAYLVMEEVPGSPLSTILNDRGRLPADEVLEMLAQAAAGLGAAHLKGIVHRDVKPANLLITPDGNLKITDFGIARAVDQASLTATGTVMGTARYLSPEQATGEPTSPASDLYSLGVVGYEALAGSSPFTAETPVAQAMAHVHDQPRPLPADVPGPVADLVMGLLNKDAEARPADGNALVKLVHRVQRGENVNLTRPHQAVGPPTDATAVLGRSAPVAATAAMPVQQPATPVAPPPRPPDMFPPAQPQRQRPRRTWTLPLIALIAIVGFILLGVLYTQFAGNGEPQPSESTVTTTFTPTTTVTETRTPTEENTPTQEQTRPTQESTPTQEQTQQQPQPDSPPVITPPTAPEIPEPQPPVNPDQGGQDGAGTQGQAGTGQDGAGTQAGTGQAGTTGQLSHQADQAQTQADGGE